MANSIIVTRGLKKDAPALATGRVGFATDTKELLVGNNGVNTEFMDKTSITAQLDNMAKGLNGSAPTLSGYTNWNSSNLPIETGTWNPMIVDTSGGESGYSSRMGRYSRIGKLVLIEFSIQNYVKEVMTGNLRLTGLPFPIYQIGAVGITVGFARGFNTGGVMTLCATGEYGANELAMRVSKADGSWIDADSTMLNGGFRLEASGVYSIA